MLGDGAALSALSQPGTGRQDGGRLALDLECVALRQTAWAVVGQSDIRLERNIVSEENKRDARLHHSLNPEDVEEILAPDFIRRRNETGSTWNRDAEKATRGSR